LRDESQADFTFYRSSVPEWRLGKIKTKTNDFNGYKEEVCLKCDVEEDFIVISKGNRYCDPSGQKFKKISESSSFEHTKELCNKYCIQNSSFDCDMWALESTSNYYTDCLLYSDR
jgi:hypothetical protein